LRKAVASVGIGVDAGAVTVAASWRALDDARHPAVRQHGALVECIGQCEAACALGHGVWIANAAIIASISNV